VPPKIPEERTIPFLFGAEVEEQASMNDNNRRYFSPEQKVTIFREHLTIFR
jgi:hypothetical protein